jgi:ankyrin repeat protein
MKFVAFLTLSFVIASSMPGLASAAGAKSRAAKPKTAASPAKAKSADADRDAMVDALANGDYVKAKALHKKGVSFDALSSADDMTGLMRVADDGIDQAVSEILKLGADINAKNSAGESALWYATYSGHEKLALSMIARGASADGQRKDSKECLLHMAVQADMVQLSKKLMQVTPKCASIKDIDGHTPAAVAKSLGYDKLAKIVTAKK